MRDPEPYPVPAKVRVCRVAGCTRTDLHRPLDVYCGEHTALVLRFRRFLDGTVEFSGDPGISGATLAGHYSPAGASFDAIRAVWARQRAG